MCNTLSARKNGSAKADLRYFVEKQGVRGDPSFSTPHPQVEFQPRE
jgi:hypothetical protein